MSDGKTIYYRASKLDCDPCPLKMKCCPKSPGRRLSRDINEAARDHTRALMETEAYDASNCERKKIETLVTIHVHQKDVSDSVLKFP